MSTSALSIKPAGSCRWDIVSLGEVMLRLDPGENRIHTSRTFNVWEGGGEYNVARGLRRCFGLKGAIVTAICDNPVGHLLEDCMLQSGLSLDYVSWKPFDGIGRSCRVGLNFTERGYGVRAAVGCSDRGLSAASQMRPGEVDWDQIFGKDGVRWFHTGGIYAGLSETTSEVVIEAVKSARKHGTIVSYDLNYRPSLWKSIGGQERARVDRSHRREPGPDTDQPPPSDQQGRAEPASRVLPESRREAGAESHGKVEHRDHFAPHFDLQPEGPVVAPWAGHGHDDSRQLRVPVQRGRGAARREVQRTHAGGRVHAE